jgi:hypothetical protein
MRALLDRAEARVSSQVKKKYEKKYACALSLTKARVSSQVLKKNGPLKGY